MPQAQELFKLGEEYFFHFGSPSKPVHIDIFEGGVGGDCIGVRNGGRNGMDKDASAPFDDIGAGIGEDIRLGLSFGHGDIPDGALKLCAKLMGKAHINELSAF